MAALPLLFIWVGVLVPWHLPELLSKGAMAEAILEQIVHDYYNIFIDGRVSMRERHGVKQKERD